MLNYNKMDEVLNNLEAQVDNFKSLSSVQEKFEGALSELSQSLAAIKIEREQVERLVNSITELETTHKEIDGKIETVLQDYKKLHSSFEYLELELKKNIAIVNDIQNDIKKGTQDSNNFFTENKNQMSKLQDELSNSKRNNKKLITSIFAGIGISILTLILSIVGLFI